MKKVKILDYLRNMMVFFLCIGLIVSFPDKILAPPGKQTIGYIPDHSIFFYQNYLSFVYSEEGQTIRQKKIHMTLDEEWEFRTITTEKAQWYDIAVEWEYKMDLKHSSGKTLELDLYFRKLNNNDCFIFINFTNVSEEMTSITYGISWADEAVRSWNEWEMYSFTYPHEQYFLQDTALTVQALETPYCRGDMVYARSKQEGKTIQTWLKGSVFHFRPAAPGLIERVDLPTSVWMDFDAEIPRTYTRSMIKPGVTLDDWILFSDGALLNIHSARTIRVLQTIDFSKIKRFSRDGFYYLTLGTGYLGENQHTYYWDYSMFASRSILEYYYNPYERLFYDIAANTYLALQMNRNATGYWSSGTISPWLRELYAIEATYFDSRFNVDAGLFLIFFYQKFHAQKALSMASKIGDLLLYFMQRDLGFRTPNDGMMVQDYVSDDLPHVRTHASLNHLLNIASFLLMLEEHTGVEYYRNGAIRTIKGIQAVEEKWKNIHTGDLYYAKFPDGRFDGQDYIFLTYHDILRYKRFSLMYLKERSPAIKRIGVFKERFLQRNNLIERQRLQERKENVYHQWEDAN